MFVCNYAKVYVCMYLCLYRCVRVFVILKSVLFNLSPVYDDRVCDRGRGLCTVAREIVVTR